MVERVGNRRHTRLDRARRAAQGLDATALRQRSWRSATRGVSRRWRAAQFPERGGGSAALLRFRRLAPLAGRAQWLTVSHMCGPNISGNREAGSSPAFHAVFGYRNEAV